MLAQLSAALALAAVAVPARAQEARDPVAAEVVFRRAVAALAADDWDAACADFQKSMLLDPSASAMAKIARCHEHEGRLASAWYDYQQALKLVAEGSYGERRRAELADFIRGAAAALEPRVPRLRVTVVPQVEGLEVLRDGQLVPRASLGEAVFVDPGTHVLEARAPGYVVARHEVTAVEGEVVVAELVLAQEGGGKGAETAPPTIPSTPLAVSPAPPSAPPAPPEVRPSAPRPWTRRHTAVTLGGAGVAALGVAAGFGVQTLVLVERSADYCTPAGECKPRGMDLREDARHVQTVGLACAGLGAVLTATGVTLWVTGRPGDAPQAAVRLSVGVAGTGLVVGSTF